MLIGEQKALGQKHFSVHPFYSYSFHPGLVLLELCHRSKDRIVPTNAWSVFFIGGFGVTHLVEFRLLAMELKMKKQMRY